MNLQSLKLKASTLCAGGTLLVFGGFLTVNLAGCGGGGGGGLTTVPTPRPIGAQFTILQGDGTAARGGTITLTGNGQTYTANADNTGVATLSNVPAGNYTVTFTATGSNGAASTPTTRPLSITRSGAQNFILVQGDTGNGPNTLTGTIFVNPNNGTTRACTATTLPYTGRVLISVRDLNDVTGSPIVAQIIREAQGIGAQGRYIVSIPNLVGQRTFRVEASAADNNGVQIAGISQTTTFVQGTNALTGVDICANTNGMVPNPVVTPTPTPAPSRTPDFIPTTTGTPNPNTTPGATATPNATAQAQATGTAGPGATATAQAGITPGAIPTTTGSVIPAITGTPVRAGQPHADNV